MGGDSPDSAVSFDLFGTLIAVDPPADPTATVAAELRARGVGVPDDWRDAYAEPHVDTAATAEVPLPTHVRRALEDRGVEVPAADDARPDNPEPTSDDVVTSAVAAAFDADVETRPGAVAAVEAAADRGPVGVLSNCSVPGLVERSLARSNLAREAFDAVVTSVGCGWRKPDRRAFEAVAAELDVPPSALVHVGDDPTTDGGAADAGATTVLLDDVPLSRIPALTEAGEWPP